MQKQLAGLVREARQRHDLSQSELGQLLGFPQSTMNKIEHGDRSLSATELLTLARLFDYDFELGVENLMEQIVSELAAGIRTFLERKTFDATSYRKRDWLGQTLDKLDHSHVG